MNVENILKVADAIEAACAPDAKPEIGFNMDGGPFHPIDGVPDLSGHNCNTVCCIAGWGRAVLGVDAWYDAKPDKASDYDKLICPPGYTDHYRYKPAHAVAVLRHLAATGEVDWTVGAPQTEEAL